jgi:hypothetical protein
MSMFVMRNKHVFSSREVEGSGVAMNYSVSSPVLTRPDQIFRRDTAGYSNVCLFPCIRIVDWIKFC